jgi:hypothetical protein
VITFKPYPIALLLSIERKTCESMGEIADVSGDTLLRQLDAKMPIDKKCELIKAFFKNENFDALIDDVIVEKEYSREIEGTSVMYNSSKGTFVRSLCSVVIMIGNGNTYVPIAHDIWVNEEIMQHDYEKKHEIAKRVLESIMQHCKIRMVIADALYATVEFMKALNELKVRFEMKMHANRTVTLESGEKVALRDVFKGKLLRGRKWRTIRVTWHGLQLNITAFKRYNKHGECKIIYLVSNYQAASSVHAKAYTRRWNIEKFFRTAKQHLGLKECQSRKAHRQKNHIDNVFIAYTILQFLRRKWRLDTPEAALRRMKKRSWDYWTSYLLAPNQIFATVLA